VGELPDEFGVRVAVQLVLPPGQVLEPRPAQGVLRQLVGEHVLAGVGRHMLPVGPEAGRDGLPQGSPRPDRLAHHRDGMARDRLDDRLDERLLGVEAVVEDAQ
jgi:hypothetical protein